MIVLRLEKSTGMLKTYTASNGTGFSPVAKAARELKIYTEIHINLPVDHKLMQHLIFF